jgi:hypothetical protein
MTSNHTIVRDPDSDFSFGVRELRQANATEKLSVNSAPLNTANEQRGVDPYNTSGSFDRKKNWAKVGRR